MASNSKTELIDKMDKALGDYYKRLKHKYYDEEEEDANAIDPEEARERFQALNEAFAKTIDCSDEELKPAREAASSLFMEFKLAPKTLIYLNGLMAETVKEVRKQDRVILDIVVEQARMDRRDFIDSFSGNEVNTSWSDKHIRAKKHYSSTIKKHLDEIVTAQTTMGATIQAQTPHRWVHAQSEKQNSAMMKQI